jgi:hypothetical protein
MATMTVKLEPDSIAQEIVARVRPYLERNPIGETAPEIIEDALHLEEDWWYIPIRLQAGKMRAYEYYDLLTDVEDEIKEREHLKVLFVPAN